MHAPVARRACVTQPGACADRPAKGRMARAAAVQEPVWVQQVRWAPVRQVRAGAALPVGQLRGAVERALGPARPQAAAV